MSDLSDLEEFNTRVTSAANGEDRWVSAPTTVRVSTVGEDVPATENPYQGSQRDVKMWAVYGGNRFSPCEHSEHILPAGQYTVEASPELGIHFHMVKANVDDLMELPDSASEDVIREVRSFWNKEQHFRKFGFLWKRGILLWGPPGSGKTVTVQLISQFVVNNNGIALYINNPHIDVKGLRLLRQIEPSRPIIIILEDIDSIIDDHGESALLALLDGELQIDNVLFIATTNYPERLDKRFVNRPSRFDLVKKIGMPTAAARKSYFEVKNLRLRTNQPELDYWVDQTNGFSIAHMKELIVSVEVFEVPLDEALMRLKKMMDIKISSEQNAAGNFGFLKS